MAAGLRIYMDRPWYSSGNGELVGVVLYSTEKFKPSTKGKGTKPLDIQQWRGRGR